MSSEVYDRQYDLHLKVMCLIRHFCDASGNVFSAVIHRWHTGGLTIT